MHHTTAVYISVSTYYLSIYLSRPKERKKMKVHTGVKKAIKAIDCWFIQIKKPHKK